jgi:hypothetical protein
MYDVDFSLFEAMAAGERLPADAPALPDSLTHLWLAPEYYWRVLIGTSAGSADQRQPLHPCQRS